MLDYDLQLKAGTLVRYSGFHKFEKLMKVQNHLSNTS
jgi:hypothetical protein